MGSAPKASAERCRKGARVVHTTVRNRIPDAPYGAQWLRASLALLLFMAAAMTSIPVLALQPCRRKPVLRVVYPTAAVGVPRDAVIFVLAKNGERYRLRRADPRGHVVAVKTAGSVLLRLAPTRPLEASTGYELQRSKQKRDYSKPGYPLSWGPYTVMTRFTTGTTLSKPATRPALLSVRVRWSKYRPRGYYRRGRTKVWTGGGGREGKLKLDAGTPHPAIVEIQLTLTRIGSEGRKSTNSCQGPPAKGDFLVTLCW